MNQGQIIQDAVAGERAREESEQLDLLWILMKDERDKK